MCSHRTLGIRR